MRLKKGRKSPFSPQVSGRRSARNLDRSASQSAFSSNASDNADVLVVPAADADVVPLSLELPPARARARREITSSGGSRRLKLLVHTGSCRIVMTGEVTPEDDALLQASMRESEEEDELGLEEGMETSDVNKNNYETDDGTAGGGEMITVKQSVLLAGDDHVHYSKQLSGFDNSEGQFV